MVFIKIIFWFYIFSLLLSIEIVRKKCIKGFNNYLNVNEFIALIYFILFIIIFILLKIFNYSLSLFKLMFTLIKEPIVFFKTIIRIYVIGYIFLYFIGLKIIILFIISFIINEMIKFFTLFFYFKATNKIIGLYFLNHFNNLIEAVSMELYSKVAYDYFKYCLITIYFTKEV